MFAHHKILMDNSPVLGYMIQGKPGDYQLIIDDVDPEAFRQMIRFFYTGDCDVENNVGKILALSTHFKITSLTNKCEEYLLSILGTINAFVIYSWADMYSLTRLKSEAIMIIGKTDVNSIKLKLVSLPCHE